MMASLLDLCVSVILHSPSLSEKAALYLPQKLSYYILHEACMSKNLAAVEKLVEAWTYPILSLDFMSFPACRQRRESSSSCLLTPEYFNIYSSVEHAPCITSIAVGLFNNVYRQVCQRSYSHLQVQEVDMSCIQASLDNVVPLQRLLAGEFPGKHASDYLPSKDKKALKAVRPRLPPPHSNSECVKLLVNLSLCRLSSLEWFTNQHCTGHFKAVITGLDLLSLHHKSILTVQLENFRLCNSALLHIKFDPTLVNAKNLSLLPSLPPPCVLSFIVPSVLETEEKYAKIFAHLLKSTSVIYAFFTNTSDERIFNALLSVVHCQIRALGIIQPTLSRNESQVNLAMVKFLQHNSSAIEYIQLRPYFLTTALTPLLVDLKCFNLRVLSIDSCGQSSKENHFRLGADIFTALGVFYNLEYFEWAEVVNLRTTDIMALYRVLTNFLPKLQHWHMYLNRILLSTTDLNDECFSDLLPLLGPMLNGKVGDESCTTYTFYLSNTAFVSWIQSLRSVCIKTGTHRDCPSAELRNFFPWLGYY